jgi:multiple antibiotic resistance protein
MFFLQSFITIFSIVNPVGAIPIFVSLTSDLDARDSRRTAMVASLCLFLCLSIFAFAGRLILGTFGIQLAAFRAGGGVLLLLMALNMLSASTSRVKQSPAELAEAMDRDSVGVVPLGIPLLAGPGAISTAIVLQEGAESLAQSAMLLGAIGLTALLAVVLLSAGAPIAKLLGRTGINVATRIMGLLLAAMAIQFLASGLGELLPGLMGLAGEPAV